MHKDEITIKTRKIVLDANEIDRIKKIANINCHGIVCSVCPLSNGDNRCLKMTARDICCHNNISYED